MDDRKGMLWKGWMALNLHGRYVHLIALVELLLHFVNLGFFVLCF